jgi:chromatin remodeling complex protein RSC6
MATAKKPAGAAKTRSTSSKTSATAKKAPAKAAAKGASKTAAKSAAKGAAKTAAKSATKSAAKAAGKKAPSKDAAGKRGPNPAFMKPLQPDAQLAAVVGQEAMPRTQVVARVWDYTKKNNLQESRNIKADEKLRPIFGKDQITMFEMMKLVNAHLSDASA